MEIAGPELTEIVGRNPARCVRANGACSRRWAFHRLIVGEFNGETSDDPFVIERIRSCAAALDRLHDPEVLRIIDGTNPEHTVNPMAIA
jgi:hypothetical protein